MSVNFSNQKQPKTLLSWERLLPDGKNRRPARSNHLAERESREGRQEAHIVVGEKPPARGPGVVCKLLETLSCINLIVC